MFQNSHSLLMADRVLKALGKSEAKEAFKNREPCMPSSHFIRTFFMAFAHDPVMNACHDLRENPQLESLAEKHLDETPEKEMKASNTSPYQRALKCFIQKKYEEIVNLCNEEIKIKDSTNLPEALLLRGTFYLLRGESDKALMDFDRILAMEKADLKVRTNAYIKRGSLRMQNEQKDEALSDFAAAIKGDPNNSDIYHHRGQLNLLIEKIDDAMLDFEKCVDLNPDFAVAQVQKCYTEHRYAFATKNPMQFQTAMQSFEEALKRFPTCSEGYALYGQSLCDQQQFEEADRHFKRALELDPDNANVYVHRGLLLLQWKQDIDDATKFIQKAIDVDDLCELAYETLGTIEVQKGSLEKAVELFNKAISLAKTEQDMAHLFSLLAAAKAQAKVAVTLGVQIPGGGVL